MCPYWGVVGSSSLYHVLCSVALREIETSSCKHGCSHHNAPKPGTADKCIIGRPDLLSRRASADMWHRQNPEMHLQGTFNLAFDISSQTMVQVANDEWL